MNWVNVATIVAVIVMVALGAYFLVWMTRSQKAAAEQYQEQLRAAAAREAAEAADADAADGAREPDAAGGEDLSDAGRLKYSGQGGDQRP
jgi:type II secretory pathway pseudopilin PulG